jgi:hypothetical protein
MVPGGELRSTNGPVFRLRPLPSILLVAAVTGLLVACAGELEGNPNDYKAAYESQAQGNTGNMPNGGAGGSSSTGGTGNGGGTVPPDPDCVAKVFANNGCTGCHSPATKQGDFDLTGSELGKRFSTLPATYKGATGNCDQGALIIDPANPSRSVLLRKVKKNQSCGSPMPLVGNLPTSDLECIEKWVNSFGASANKLSLEGSGTGGNNL